MTYPLTLIIGLTILALAIPVAILLGQWVRGGPIAVASGGALLAFAAFWLQQWDAVVMAPQAQRPPDATVAYLTLESGAFLLIAAWTLALAKVMRLRQWGWLVALLAGMYATVADIIHVPAMPFPGCFNTMYAPYILCAGGIQFSTILTVGGIFAGPVVALIYALHASGIGKPTPPPGLSVSPLDGPESLPSGR